MMKTLKKILILTDIHLGESRCSTTHTGVIRQANSQAEHKLQELVEQLKPQKFDLLVHLGDALRDEHDKQVDKHNFKKALKLLKQIEAPQIHLLGNHELRSFSREEVASHYQALEYKADFYGKKDFSNAQVVWLDVSKEDQESVKLPEETLKWLQDAEFESHKPLLVFSHYSAFPINAKGSFYFENKPDKMLFKNRNDITKIVNGKHSASCLWLNGHVHLLSHQQLDSNHFISAPSFTENITAESFPENNPGVYSIIELKENEFIFTSYSGKFCFAKIQGEL
jgi:DNA repair exonuclease SbcCD nuclease subunit